MGTMASQITSLTIVYSTVYSGADQRKHQSSTSQAFVRGIHRRPVNSPHKWPVTRQMFPFDDVIMFNVLETHGAMRFSQISSAIQWRPPVIKDKGMFIMYIQYYGDARSQVSSNHGSTYLNKIEKKLVVSSSLQTTNVELWNQKFLSK